MNAQNAANHIFVDLDAESQRDLLGNSGTAPAEIPPFHFHEGVDSSCFGPCGPGRWPSGDENNMRYFRFFSRLWKCSRVEVFSTTAERRRLAGRMKRMHKPAMIRSAARRLGARLRPRLRIKS